MRLLVFLVLAVALRAEQTTATTAGEPENLSADQLSTLFEEGGSGSSSFAFEADVSRLMDIIINSLYTHKEVFLRELISNASDALNKIRYQSISEPELLGEQKDLEVRIDFNADDKTISITDTGIGMTKNDLVKNLGTVASSGTTNFIEALGKGNEFSQLIGQFGVGFYSVYLVANKVVVTSKHNDDDQHVWTSTAGREFQVAKDPRGNTLKRGTRVTLHLKEDAIEMVEQAKIKELVKRYSEYIDFPIYVYMLNKKTKQVPEEELEDDEDGEKPEETTTEPEDSEEDGEKEEKDDEGIEEEDEAEGASGEKEPKMKTVTEEKWEWELVNDTKAIWLRPKDEIEEEEYESFYKAISNDYEKPLTYSHFTAEGEIEFRSLLYVPAHAPYDMFENYYGRSSALKLYVRRVLITDEFEELLPRYLNFVKGVLDSDDLPLNVSREQLQQLKILKVISKKLVRKSIDMIRELAAEDEDDDDETEEEEEETTTQEEEEEEKSEDKKEEDDDDEEEEVEEGDTRYEKFFKAFGKNIKLGVIEDSHNRNKLAKLLRFYSSKSVDKLISLQQYIDRMPEKQENIYYLAGEDRDAMLKSPLLSRMLKEGIEVLLMDDPIDEFCMQHLAEFNKHKLQSAAKEGVDFDEDLTTKKKEAKVAKMYEPLVKWLKDVIGKEVEKVKISNRLTDIPCVIVSSQYGYSAQMEKVSRAQAFANSEKTPSYQLSRKHFELNPYHPAIKTLLDKVVKAQEEETEVDDETRKQAMMLWDLAIVNSGFLIERTEQFTKEIERLVNYRLGLDPDAENIEIEVDLDDDDDEEEEAVGDDAGEEAEDASNDDNDGDDEDAPVGGEGSEKNESDL